MSDEVLDDPPADDPPAALLEAATAAIPLWLDRRVMSHVEALPDARVDPTITQRVDNVVATTSDDIVSALAALLSSDIDDQATSPLALIRARLGPANALLLELGAVPPHADQFERQAFADDPFRLGPASWADIDAALHEPGLRWGAWKAFATIRRHG